MMKSKNLSFAAGLAGLVAVLGVTATAVGQHPLDSWARHALPGPNSPLNSIAYGNGTYVAVGDNSFVARSIDGTAWTTSTAGPYGTLRRVRFLNGQFVAVGSSDKIIYSSNGATWTPVTLPQSVAVDVAWGNGVYVLAGQRAVLTQGAYVSSDGVNWTRTHPVVVDPLSGPYELALDTIVFANGGFLGLPTSSGGRFAPTVFSTNGMDWVSMGVAQESASAGDGEFVYQDGVWLSTAELDSSTQNGVLVSTNNGGTWCCRFNTGPGGGALAAAQGYFLTFLNSGPGSIFVSSNGLSWESRFSGGPGVGNLKFRAATFGNGSCVAVGSVDANAALILQSAIIGGAPTIFQEPQDRSAVVDNPATFSVEAVGAPPLTYQWYRNGTLINDATNTSYTIAHVTTGDIGGYHVLIANSINSVTSRVAQLSVSFLAINQYAGIKILGVLGRMYQIDATPASGPPNWQTLTNLMLPSNPYIWIDYESPNVSSRLYRAAELP